MGLISWSREPDKLILRKYLFAKIIIVVDYFRKTFHRRCLTGLWICLRFWICQRSESTGVLNIPGLWICQGSEYSSGTEYVRTLDISWFYARVTHGSKFAWICLNNSWICLIMSEFAWICLNGFCFKFTHCSSLSKGTIECFLGK